MLHAFALRDCSVCGARRPDAPREETPAKEPLSFFMHGPHATLGSWTPQTHRQKRLSRRSGIAFALVVQRDVGAKRPPKKRPTQWRRKGPSSEESSTFSPKRTSTSLGVGGPRLPMGAGPHAPPTHATIAQHIKAYRHCAQRQIGANLATGIVCSRAGRLGAALETHASALRFGRLLIWPRP